MRAISLQLAVNMCQRQRFVLESSPQRCGSRMTGVMIQGRWFSHSVRLESFMDAVVLPPGLQPLADGASSGAFN